MSGVTRAGGTKLCRVWSTLLGAAVPPQPFPAQRNLQELSGNCCGPLPVHRQRRKTLCCCQLLCPPGVLLPKHSVLLMVRGHPQVLSENFPSDFFLRRYRKTHLDCGNAGTQELRKATFQVYSPILVKTAFLFCSHEVDK